jgi:coenzyme F420 hydrogenase subunit beta
MSETIDQILKEHLCTGCGTCAGVCSNSAIVIQIDLEKGIYFPEINHEACSQCGNCLQVCPAAGIDHKKFNIALFGKEPEDIRLGNYIGYYKGYAIDYDIRFNSSSGGLVTAILCYALEKGIIDGALVTQMRKDKPLVPRPFIAHTRDDIIEAARSKYCPVPANVAIKEILQSPKLEKIAVVGLPCHIQGIRKAEKKVKKLQDSIVLHLGLICSHTDTFFMTNFVLKKYKIKRDDVIKLDYRGKGWPGSWTVQLRNKKELIIPYNKYITWHNIWLSVPEGCSLCTDVNSELSDISFGDLWLREYIDDNAGLSLAITRTHIGDEIIRQTSLQQKIKLDILNPNNFLQDRNSYAKKCGAVARMKLFHRGMNIPGYVFETNIFDYVWAFYRQVTASFLFLHPLVRKFIGFLPVQIARYFDGVTYLIANFRIKRLIPRSK